MKGLLNLGALLDKVALTPERPQQPATPPPMKQKVVSRSPRDPINRQAALIIAKPPWWAKLEAGTGPVGPPPTLSPELLKEARKEIANLQKIICNLRRQLAEAREAHNIAIADYADERTKRSELEAQLKRLLS